MKSKMFGNLKKNPIPLIFIFLILISIIYLEVGFNPKIEGPIPIGGNYKEKAINILVEINKLIISLSILILGGVGAMVLKKEKSKDFKLRVNQIFVTIIVFCLSLSIYFGYFFYFKIAELLAYNTFAITPTIYLPLRMQFFSFMTAIILFGFLFINNMVRQED